MKIIIIALCFLLAHPDAISQVLDLQRKIGCESTSVRKINDSTFERTASQLGIFKPALYIEGVEKRTSSVVLKGLVLYPNPGYSVDSETGKNVTTIVDSSSKSGTLFLCAQKKKCNKKRKCFKILSKYDFSDSVFNIELDKRKKNLILILQINGQSEMTSGVFLVSNILIDAYKIK